MDRVDRCALRRPRLRTGARHKIRGCTGQAAQRSNTRWSSSSTRRRSAARRSPPTNRAILFSSNKTGIWNAYTMPVSGGAWTPVTKSTTDSTYAVSFFPNDNRILITRDQGGNELNHLYVRTAAGEESDLTPGDKLKAQFGGWTHDGAAFYVQTNERDPKFFDIYRYDARTYARTLFYENKDGTSRRRSRRRKVARAGEGEHDQRQRHVSSGTPSTKADDAHLEAPGNANYASAAVRPRVEEPVLHDRRRRRVRARCGATRSPTASTKTSRRRTGTSSATSSRTTASTGRPSSIRTRGPSSRIVRDGDEPPVPLPAVPNGGVTGLRFRAQRNEVGTLRSTAIDRRTTCTCSISRQEADQADRLAERRRSTRPISSTPQIVRFKARDGMTDPEHSAEAAAGDAVEQGAGAGLGARRPRRPDDARVQRADAVSSPTTATSCSASTTAAAPVTARRSSRPTTRSTGTNRCGTASTARSTCSRCLCRSGSHRHHRRQLWRLHGARRARVPAATSSRSASICSAWRTGSGRSRAFRRGGKRSGRRSTTRWAIRSKDRKMLEEVSPLLHADLIRKPLIVLQGANDPRVLKVESDEVVAAVKKNGVPAEYIVFPDEGHGFTKKRESDRGLYRGACGFSISIWVADRHLAGERVAVSSRPRARFRQSRGASPTAPPR